MKQGLPRIWLRAGRAGVSAAMLSLAACAPGVLSPAGPVAAGERTILFNALAIMMLIVVPTIVITIAFAWWFRAGNTRATYRPTWSYSGRIELLVWSVPALIVIFLAGLTWIGTHELAPEKPLASKMRPVTVQVVALDWKWLFIYPEQGIATVNRLVIPAGTPIAFRITSGTVMNSFFVPQLGSQIYAMAGMDSRLHLQADRPGRFHGLSAHYSGEGFADMDFAVDAVPPAQFAAWVAKTRGAGPVLNDARMATLAKPTIKVAPHAYRAVPPSLYDRIVANAGVGAQEQARSGREDNHVR
jgi:cytochrome o ubiquinol oxidase subunit 2